jgi:maleate cis-trans isomerase
MIGWRGKLGIMVPSISVAMEPEFYKIVPKGVSVHFSRITSTPSERTKTCEILKNSTSGIRS